MDKNIENDTILSNVFLSHFLFFFSLNKRISLKENIMSCLWEERLVLFHGTVTKRDLGPNIMAVTVLV